MLMSYFLRVVTGSVAQGSSTDATQLFTVANEVV